MDYRRFDASFASRLLLSLVDSKEDSCFLVTLLKFSVQTHYANWSLNTQISTKLVEIAFVLRRLKLNFSWTPLLHLYSVQIGDVLHG